jgi:HD superfamily phosphohydrolase
VLRSLLSGSLDVDKLDYLPRDARACNVPYGGVDTARLIDALDFSMLETDDPGEPRGGRQRPRIVVGAKGVSPLHSLINARQEMFDNVYWHHTNRACMAMLLRAVQEAVREQVIDPAELATHDDFSLLARLSADDMPETTWRLTQALRERRIHKRAVEVSARAFELYARLGNLFFDPEARRQVELEMTRQLSQRIGISVPADAVLIDIPKPEKWRTHVWVHFDKPPVGFQELMPWKDVVGLSDDDFKRYEEHRRLIRIVAAAPFRDAVREHWEALVYPLLGGVM